MFPRLPADWVPRLSPHRTEARHPAQPEKSSSLTLPVLPASPPQSPGPPQAGLDRWSDESAPFRAPLVDPRRENGQHWRFRKAKQDAVGKPRQGPAAEHAPRSGPEIQEASPCCQRSWTLFDLVLYLFHFQEANVELAAVKPRRIGLLEEITTNPDLHGAASLTSGRKNRKQ